MSTFRDQKRAARQTLHATMAEPVLYLPSKGSAPTLVSARVHTSFSALGDLRRSGFAESNELTPQAVFLRAELVPVRMTVFVTEDLGAFVIDQTDPPHDITITVRIARLPQKDYAAWGLTPDVPWCGLTPPAG